ncbi:SMC-Scp complex subunit ScpB [bacterium]|nr:SMC-Scp complex subunit ScpB [bacterium]
MKDNKINIKNAIEAILFVAEKSVNIKEFAQIVGVSSQDIQKEIGLLSEEYKKRGLRLINKGSSYQLISAPEEGPYVARYLNQELKKELGQAALEALAIITYKQPITRVEVEKVRGVNCDAIMRTLQIKGLIEEVSRKDAPGRPILYGTTFEFLQYLGVENIDELPSLTDEEKERIKPTFTF